MRLQGLGIDIQLEICNQPDPYQSATNVKATPGLGMVGQVVIDLISVLPQKDI